MTALTAPIAHVASSGDGGGVGSGAARVVTREKKVMSAFMRGQGSVPAWPMPRRRGVFAGEEGAGLEGGAVVMGVVATMRVRWGRGRGRWLRVRAEVVMGEDIISVWELGWGVGIAVGVGIRIEIY